MKKFIITILLVFLISIVFSSLVNAVFRDAFWECTSQGEQSHGDAFGRFSPSLQPDGICKKSCCILCVSRSPIRDCFGGSAKPMCSCSQSSSTDSEAPVLTVNSPVKSTIFEKRAVDVNLQSSESVKLEWLDNNHPERGYKRLCTKCLTFIRKVSFSEGSNDITFRATDKGNNFDEERITFMIDSKKPRISKAEPKKYGNGEFKITYDEDNLKKSTIFYRTSLESEYSSTSTNECPSGKKQTCTMNIPNLQNGDLYYYPEIEDIVGRLATAKEQKIIIDRVNPVLTLDQTLQTQPLTFTKTLPLKLTVSEKVTLTYQNLNDASNSKILCKNCNSYDRSLTFRKGNYNLKMTATDNAGNVDQENLVFTIL